MAVKPAPLMVCVESFGSGDPEYGSCAEGVRLRADHPSVLRRPQFFAPADSSWDEIKAVRDKLYEED